MNEELREGRRHDRDDSYEKPLATKTITNSYGADLTDLCAIVIESAEVKGYKAEMVFHPDDAMYEPGGRFIIRIEIDPANSEKDLIFRPAALETFTFEGESPAEVVLETSSRAPRLMNEEMTATFRLIDEMQPLTADLGALIQEQLSAI